MDRIIITRQIGIVKLQKKYGQRNRYRQDKGKMESGVSIKDETQTHKVK